MCCPDYTWGLLKEEGPLEDKGIMELLIQNVKGASLGSSTFQEGFSEKEGASKELTRVYRLSAGIAFPTGSKMACEVRQGLSGAFQYLGGKTVSLWTLLMSSNLNSTS